MLLADHAVEGVDEVIFADKGGGGWVGGWVGRCFQTAAGRRRGGWAGGWVVLPNHAVEGVDEVVFSDECGCEPKLCVC